MNAEITEEQRAHYLAIAAQEAQNSYRPKPMPVGKPRAWFVVQSTAHGEDDAAKAIQKLGCEVYLPKLRKDIFNRRNRIWVEREYVLFNRYLFAEIPEDPEAWAAVRQVEEVDTLLGMDGHPVPIGRQVIERFRDAEAALAFDETRDAQIKRGIIGRRKRETAKIKFPLGCQVRIKEGPFGGFYGQVVNVTGRAAVQAMLNLFGQMTPVEFPIAMVERA